MTDYDQKVIYPSSAAGYYKDWQFSPAIQFKELLFISGCTGTLDDGSIPEGIIAQTQQAFLKIKKSLDEAGSSFSDVIEMTTYHVGLNNHLDDFKKAKDEYICEPYPAWTAIGVCELAKEGALVEIRIVAINQNRLKLRSINSDNTPIASGGYSQAIEVSNNRRTLYISGQIPESPNGSVPKSFEDQARMVWSNITGQLEAANMTLDNIVKHTTFLSDRKYRDANSLIRQEILAERKPALTVIIAQIYDEEWLLEIEAVAVD